VFDPTFLELALKLGRGAAHLQRLRIAAATTAHMRDLGYPAPIYRIDAPKITPRSFE
jgi:hypothetical protein